MQEIITCHFGTFHPTTYNLGEIDNPVGRIMEELEREKRGVFPEALALLTPEERKKYKIQEALTYEAYDMLNMETKRFTKRYKTRVPRSKM